MPPRRPRREVSFPHPKKLTPSKKHRDLSTTAFEKPAVTHQDVLDVQLKPLRFVTKQTSTEEQVVEINQEMAVPLSQVTLEHSMAHGGKIPHPDTVTLLFVIRRTGCGNCREHGKQLSELACSMDEHVHMSGVVKPEAVPNEILLEFYTDYFNFPLYQDDDWKLATGVLGDRKLSMWKMLKAAPKLGMHYQKHNIHNIPFGGDLWTHGGLLILDSRSRLRFVYYEKYGEELDLEAIRWAIDDTRRAAQKVDVTPSLPFRSVVTYSDKSPSPPERTLSYKSTATASTQPLSDSEHDSSGTQSLMSPSSCWTSLGSIDSPQVGPPRHPQRQQSASRSMQESPWSVAGVKGKQLPEDSSSFWKRSKLPSRQTLPMVLVPFLPYHPNKNPKSITETDQTFSCATTTAPTSSSPPAQPQRKGSFSMVSPYERYEI